MTYPLALLALATLPALAAIYILRNRFRRRVVSSVVLWHFQVQSKTGGAKVHRLQLPLLFFLELLALILLVTAATGPHWILPQSRRPLIIVLDDSFSMQAMSDGVSAQARAKTYLQKLFRFQPPPTTRLILAGTRASLLGSPVTSWSQVNDLLHRWHCWSPDAALDSAVTLASELGRQQANILVLTDHKPAAGKFSNNRIEWRAFGRPVDNFAIINASRTAFGDQDRCLLEVANFSGQTRSTRLLVQTGTNAVESSILSINAHGSRRLIFNISDSAPILYASLDHDALNADNEAELLPPIRRKVRVQVALANENLSSLANRTLDATGLRAAISTDPELVIQSSPAPVGSNVWRLRWTGSAGTNAFIGPFVVDNSHPLAEGVALDGVVWAGQTATNSPGDVPVVLAGNTPLLSVREDEFGHYQLTLNFNPALSTLQDTPDWPVLFWDLLHWRAEEIPGLEESNARLGTEVMLKTTGAAVTVRQPDGTIRSFQKTGGDLALETPMPGIYSVSMGMMTNQFAVNPLSADESDLLPCVTGQWGTWTEATERRLEETSAVWIFGLLALALLTAHLYLVTAGKGGK